MCILVDFVELYVIPFINFGGKFSSVDEGLLIEIWKAERIEDFF